MSWIYNKKVITELSQLPNAEELVGFVYLITDTVTGKFYIGRKSVYSTRKTKISKREKVETKTRKTFKHTVKETNWLTYTGSCKELNEDISKLGLKRFKKEIIELCYTTKYLGYAELAHQIKNDVLTSNCYNGNILGKFFTKDMLNQKQSIC